MQKSIVSNELIEFAKMIKGKNINYTPIGPGLILRTIRDNRFIFSLLNEMFRLELLNLDSLLYLISNPFKQKLFKEI